MEQGSSIKISLRSNDDDLDMNVFANRFGGGGHARASGCVMDGELHSIAQKVMSALKEYYKEVKKQEP
jgi:phosphoesterase RecJ-like protein